MRFVCWAPMTANDFFISPLETVVDITGVSFPEPGREPGPLAFSDRTSRAPKKENLGASEQTCQFIFLANGLDLDTYFLEHEYFF